MVYMFLANGFEEVEALCPLDLLRRAGISTATVGIGGSAVTGAHGITVLTDMTEAEYADDAPEMVILPGGMPGTANLDASATVDAALRTAYACGAAIAAICAAPSVLGKRGYLQGVRAVCFPGFEADLHGAILMPEGHRVVTDRRFVTAVGMGAATEFGLALVRLLKGDACAQALAEAVFAD